MRNPFLILSFTIALAFATTAGAYEIGEVPLDKLGKARGGDEVRLSESAGKIRIVTFWATWCPPCMKELPVLAAIQQQAGPERVQIVAINLKEERRVFKAAAKALDGYGLTFIHDKYGWLSKKFEVPGIPYMLIIDADGTIEYKHVGYSESALGGIVDEINGLLVRNGLAGQP